MKKKSLGFMLLILTLMCPAILIAQDELNPIQTVVPFLTISPDSRSGAMGDAGAATSPDLFSQHWNPAKFAFIDGKGGFAIAYSPWLRTLVPDINLAYFSLYKRFDSKQVGSVSLFYSSLGNIPFTDNAGNIQREFTPNEFSADIGYSRIFTEHLSGGIAFRFIYSNLTGGFSTGGTETKPGISFAADISGYYTRNIELGSKDGNIAFGLNFSNIGSKMSYTDSKDPDFIPMNMKLGTAGTVVLDNFNKITLTFDINKLLVPTPPIYYNVGDTTSSGVVVTVPQSEIKDGKDPNVSVPVAIFQSFYDAPGGFMEELHEIMFAIGAEYWYHDQFAIRGGYFYEHETKGNRKYFTLGAGLRMNIFTLDFSYLLPTAQNHPLSNTLRFSLSFEFSALRNASKSRG